MGCSLTQGTETKFGRVSREGRWSPKITTKVEVRHVSTFEDKWQRLITIMKVTGPYYVTNNL